MEDETDLPSPGPETQGRKAIARSARKEEILEQSLVLASQGIRHWMEFDGEQFILTLEESSIPLAMEILDLYQDENVNFRDAELPPGQVELYLAPIFHLAIPVAAYFWVGLQPWGNWLTSQGLSDSRAILEEGQWWRCLTATTLHADHEHFLGNILSGFFILNLLNHRLGMGLIMLLATFGAGLTNFLVALASTGDHRSLGFSSVVFCVLGMLGAVESAQLRKSRDLSLRRLTPLLAAFFIAVMVGLGENADVKAHFYGFGIGAALGFLAGRLPGRLAGPPWQVVMALATCGAYLLAWWRAYES